MPDDLSSILESPEHTLLASGLGATEGPLWHPGGYLTLVDLGGRLLKWDPNAGISVLREDTGEGNGCTFDRDGNLILCEGEHRSVTRSNSDGTITTIADRYQGKLLNRPNDVVCRSDRSIYFTDPSLRVPANTVSTVSQGCSVLPRTESSIWLQTVASTQTALRFPPMSR